MSQNAIISYIDSLVTDGEILEGKLIGYNENDTGRARFLFETYDLSSDEKEVFIKPYLDTYKYYVINNKLEDVSVIDDPVRNLKDRIIKIENKLDNLTDILADSIPKADSSVDSYKETRANKILDAWREFAINNPNAVSSEIKDGLKNFKTLDSELTAEQIANKNKVKNWVYKLIARYRIEAEVGDIFDLHADLSKRVAVVERLAMRHFLDYVNEYTMDANIKTRYVYVSKPQVANVDAGIAIDRSDLIDANVLIDDLSTKRGKIKDIVKEEYIDKKID